MNEYEKKQNELQNTKDLILQCDLAWQEKFLELTGLKIGNTIECYFSTFSGNSNRCFQSLTKGKGTIVMTDKGIFVKSNEKYTIAHEKRKYPNRPTNTQTYWSYQDEYVFSKLDKSILQLNDFIVLCK